MFPPIVAQNRAATLSIFHRSLIGPGMNFQTAGAFRAAISKKLPRPPALKISTTPNADALHMWQFEHAIDPTAATPFRRAHVPVRVIVQRHDNHRLRRPPDPKRSQMMKVTGSVKQKGRETRLKFAVELVNQTRRRGETKLRPPLARFNNRQAKRLVPPRVIQVEMQSAADQANLLRGANRVKTLTCCMSESCKCPLNRRENQSRLRRANRRRHIVDLMHALSNAHAEPPELR